MAMDNEHENIFAIPANYTDSGKILGGLLEPRNALETAILLILVGYPELMIPMPGPLRIIVMAVTLIPLGILSAVGVNGDSLFQYVGHVIRFFINRRKLHLRRVGYKYDQRHFPKRKRAKAKTKA